MKKSIRDILVLVCICAAISLVLAATNAIASPIIAENEAKAANEALLQVMPNGEGFEKLDISSYTLPSTVSEAYKEKGGGYVFKLNATGFNPNMIIMCGVNADGTVSGALCLSSEETWGKEKTFGDLVKGKDSQTIADVEAGATSLTVKGYRAAVADALNAAIILGGGSVDLRTEEEILNDNLKAALPGTDGKFSKLFLVEIIDGVNAIYLPDNSDGAVCVIGETFVGVGADGVAIGNASAEDKAKAEAAVATVNATTLTSLNLTEYTGISSLITSARKTATGNYEIVIRAEGYGILGDYHASGEYIVIKVSLTAEGKTIDCVTVSQSETAKLGGIHCEDYGFYGQFIDKTKSECEAVDTITGATLTTQGYKTAILRAFEAVIIFEGGNS